MVHLMGEEKKKKGVEEDKRQQRIMTKSMGSGINLLGLESATS